MKFSMKGMNEAITNRGNQIEEEQSLNGSEHIG